jgi:hypothetical protein
MDASLPLIYNFPWIMDASLLRIHNFPQIIEVFTVPHVFPPESGGIRGNPGIPGESDLAVGPAKLEFSIPGHSGGMQPGIGSFPEW